MDLDNQRRFRPMPATTAAAIAIFFVLVLFLLMRAVYRSH
jgi:hypothetical protein